MKRHQCKGAHPTISGVSAMGLDTPASKKMDPLLSGRLLLRYEQVGKAA